MAEEQSKYKAQLVNTIKTQLAEVDQILSKRAYDAGPPVPNKAPCSMFTKLFGPRRQSVTREDFDQTWERLEQRKEHYKSRTEELTARMKNKDDQVDGLERRIKELEKRLKEEQKNIDTLRGYIKDFYKKVEQSCIDSLEDPEDLDDEVDLKGSSDVE